MKHFILIIMMACCFACTKTAINTVTANNTQTRISNDDQPTFLSKDLGGSVLTISLQPDLVCYTNDLGQPAKPCNIFVDMVCSLSAPLSNPVMITIQKSNKAEDENITNPVNEEPTSAQAIEENNITFTIGANTTSFTFKSPFQNNNNVLVPDGEYKIISASVFKQVY